MLRVLFYYAPSPSSPHSPVIIKSFDALAEGGRRRKKSIIPIENKRWLDTVMEKPASGMENFFLLRRKSSERKML
jgi:hypothetical protein